MLDARYLGQIIQGFKGTVRFAVFDDIFGFLRANPFENLIQLISARSINIDRLSKGQR